MTIPLSRHQAKLIAKLQATAQQTQQTLKIAQDQHALASSVLNDVIVTAALDGGLEDGGEIKDISIRADGDHHFLEFEVVTKPNAG